MPDLRPLPPSAILVYKVIERHDGPLRRQAVIEATCLKPRTVTDALRRLRERGYITTTRDPTDARHTRVDIARD